MRLADRQQAFGRALLDLDAPPPPGLIGPGGAACPERFAVYRNNRMAALITTLTDAYPVVARLVGEAFFRAMAADYARQTPPTSPILLQYGDGFPEFIDGFPPARDLPYLGDIARLERAWREAYHAAEAASLDPALLVTVPAADYPGLKFTLHPSLRIVHATLPIFALWIANLAADDAIDPVSLEDHCEDLLVLRPEETVEVRRLPQGGAVFIEALARGDDLATAAGAAHAVADGFDLAALLTGLLAAGAFGGFWIAAPALRPQA